MLELSKVFLRLDQPNTALEHYTAALQVLFACFMYHVAALFAIVGCLPALIFCWLVTARGCKGGDAADRRDAHALLGAMLIAAARAAGCHSR